MRHWRLAPIGLLLGLAAGVAANPCADGPCVAGTVVGIADGDTLTLLVAEAGGPRQARVRLTDIDAPERAQPWGARARQALAGKVFQRRVQVASSGQDRYGRLLGRIHLDGRDINREMVREGHAWVYRRYSSDIELLADERSAQRSGAGLWSLREAERVPPWEWRRGARAPKAAQAAKPSAAGAATTAGGHVCGEKRTCRDMTSCAEARFHQTRCGLAGLDGDGDGMPCEALCRDASQPGPRLTPNAATPADPRASPRLTPRGSRYRRSRTSSW